MNESITRYLTVQLIKKDEIRVFDKKKPKLLVDILRVSLQKV